jgi:hypothetical protein
MKGKNTGWSGRFVQYESSVDAHSTSFPEPTGRSISAGEPSSNRAETDAPCCAVSARYR